MEIATRECLTCGRTLNARLKGCPRCAASGQSSAQSAASPSSAGTWEVTVDGVPHTLAATAAGLTLQASNSALPSYRWELSNLAGVSSPTPFSIRLWVDSDSIDIGFTHGVSACREFHATFEQYRDALKAGSLASQLPPAITMSTVPGMEVRQLVGHDSAEALVSVPAPADATSQAKALRLAQQHALRRLREQARAKAVSAVLGVSIESRILSSAESLVAYASARGTQCNLRPMGDGQLAAPAQARQSPSPSRPTAAQVVRGAGAAGTLWSMLDD